MTANQINFAKLAEEKRHNVVTEGENLRHNVETESISRSEQIATQEHYIRQDAINEEHYGRMDAETARSNLRGEELKEREQNLTNRQLDIKQQEANTSWYQAQVHNQQVLNDYEVGMIQASASADQATAALINANTNAEKLKVDQQNADTNARNADTKELEVQYYGEEVGTKKAQVGVNYLNYLATATDIYNRANFMYNETVHMKNQDMIALGNLAVARNKAEAENYRNYWQGNLAQAQTAKTENEAKLATNQSRKAQAETNKLEKEAALKDKDLEWYNAKQVQSMIGTGVDVVNAITKVVGLVLVGG